MEVQEEWIISRICEEFHCLPREAIEAWENDVGGLIGKIIDLRAYYKAYRAVKDTEGSEANKKLTGPVYERVRSMEMEIARDRMIEKLKNS